MSLSFDKIVVWRKFRNQETLTQRKYSFGKYDWHLRYLFWIIKFMISIRTKAHKVDIFILENHVITASWWDSFTIFIALYRSKQYIPWRIYCCIHILKKKPFIVWICDYCVVLLRAGFHFRQTVILLQYTQGILALLTKLQFTSLHFYYHC